LVPSLHADPPNPHIDFDGAGLRVQRTSEEWPARLGPDAQPLPRRAGISAFGAGGANAHLIVEEAPQPTLATTAPTTTVPTQEPELIVLSAMAEDRLRVLAGAMAERASAAADLEPAEARAWLARAGYTLRHGRAALPWRLATVVLSATELADRLRDFAEHGTAEHIVCGAVEGRPTGHARSGETTGVVEPVESARRWVSGEPVDWADH